MINRGEQFNDQCVYCGATRNLTKDHIPPKNLFPNPRPSNLITVPCCYDCNHQTSLDDEYFRLILSTCQAASDHPAAKRLWPAIRRSLSRPHKPRIKEVSFIETPKARAPSELLAQRNQAFVVDCCRIDKILAKIVRGLFFHQRGYRLPSTYEVITHSNSLLNRAVSQKNEPIEFPVQSLEAVGDGVFSYGSYFYDGDSDTSIWLLSFFEKVQFSCWIRA